MITAASSDVTSNIDLYDSDIKRITDGPLAWANSRIGTSKNIDSFHQGLTEQFEKIGLRVDVQVYTMGVCKCLFGNHSADACPSLVPVDGAYIFQVVIQGRITPESGFDYDRMKHEIRSNLLDIPGEGGVIKFDEKEFLRRHGGGSRHRH